MCGGMQTHQVLVMLGIRRLEVLYIPKLRDRHVDEGEQHSSSCDFFTLAQSQVVKS